MLSKKPCPQCLVPNTSPQNLFRHRRVLAILPCKGLEQLILSDEAVWNKAITF